MNYSSAIEPKCCFCSWSSILEQSLTRILGTDMFRSHTKLWMLVSSSLSTRVNISSTEFLAFNSLSKECFPESVLQITFKIINCYSRSVHSTSLRRWWSCAWMKSGCSECWMADSIIDCRRISAKSSATMQSSRLQYFPKFLSHADCDYWFWSTYYAYCCCIYSPLAKASNILQWHR